MRVGRALGALAVGAWIAVSAARAPAWNFDALLYAGVVHTWRGHPPREAWRRVYAELPRLVPPGQARALRELSPYRRRVAERPRAFASQLGMYRNKPLYPLLAAAFPEPLQGLFLVSAIAAGLLVPVLAAWLAPLGGGALPAAVLLALLPPVRGLGVLATPDALGLLLLAATGLARSRGLGLLAPLLGCLAALARPDLSLLAGALLLGAGTPRRWRPRDLAVAATPVAVAVAASHLLRAWPLPALIVHTFAHRLYAPRVAGWPEAWWDALRRGVATFLGPGAPGWAGAALATLLAVRRDRAVPPLLLVWGAGLLRLAIFPLVVDRMVAPLVVCAWAVSLRVLAADGGRAPGGSAAG